MKKQYLSLLSAILVISSATAFAQKPVEGSLNVDGKNYPLNHALAYEATIDGEERIAVVLSGQAVASAKLKEVREEEKNGHAPGFNRPFLKFEFTKEGKLEHWSAAAGNTSLGGGSSETKAELKVANGRATGSANDPIETEGNFRAGFDVRFDVALLGATELSTAENKMPGPAANVKPTVSGTFKGNGKEAKIAFVSAQWREPFSDKPSIRLVFTEKDHSKDKKPDFKAAFGEYGNALVISIHEDGSIFGCQVTHNAHEKKGFTALGEITMDNFQFENGKVEGDLVTPGQLDFFGETWEVNLKFVAPLGEIPPEFQTDDQKKSGKPTAGASPSPTKSASAKPTATKATATSTAQPAGDQLKVKDLALTKDASDFNYATLVQHLSFKSKSAVKSVCTELAASLKAQGWTTEGRDMVNASSSIMKRKRGEASLTIFVKPDGEGSTVTMFTKGLSWEGQ